ncbi:MAG: diguanylate cyclase [Candidatus Riflebacteria bacterium]|nr:diguanylate cyclase [Candidatus Riflebacteria bacterium]
MNLNWWKWPENEKFCIFNRLMTEPVLNQKIPFIHSIKVKAWLAVLFMAVVPLVALGLYSLSILSQITHNLIIKSNLQAVQQVKSEIEDYLQLYRGLIALLKTDKRLETPNSPEASEALRELKMNYEFLEYCILYNNNSRAIVAHSRKEYNETPNFSENEKGIFSLKKKLVFYPGKFFLFESLPDPNSDFRILLSVSFQKLKKSLDRIALGTSFHVSLVDQAGMEVLGQNQLDPELVKHLVKQEYGAYEVFFNNETEASSIAVILPMPSTGLNIIVTQEGKEVFSLVKNMKTGTFGVIAIVALVAFFFGTFFSIQMTSPIIMMADKANEISMGNLEVDVRSNRRDEIGFLASCFNQMTVKIRKKVFELTALYNISSIINRSATYQEALDKALAHVVLIFKAKRGSIMLLEEADERLRLSSVKISEELPMPEKKVIRSYVLLKKGIGLAGKALEEGVAKISLDCQNDENFLKYNDSFDLQLPSMVLCAPLLINGKAIGVINLADRLDNSPFMGDELDLLMTIASQTALSIANARLNELAITDGLTQLFIHRYFQLKLDEELKRSTRFNDPISLILFDIDHFKKFNDTWGHQQGDMVLKEVAKLLKESVRDTDIPCRYGGEEFTIILPRTTAEQAIVFAERLRKTVETNNFSGQEKPLSVTISIGIAEYPKMAKSKAELVKFSDKALYYCKKQGRNCTNIYSTEME